MAIFELVSAEGTPVSLPGPWDTRVVPPSTGVSFGIGGQAESAPGPREQLWRITLPADLAAAHDQLSAGDAVLRANARAVEAAPARLSAALRQPEGLSFSVGTPAPEAELGAMLSELRAAQRAGDGVSFGMIDDSLESWKAATAKFQDFTRRAYEAVAFFAVVETRIEVDLIGRTTVGWGGDMRTIWLSDFAVAEADLHRRSLDLALQSRATLIRTASMVLRGAAIVGRAMFGGPAGMVTALPAAWKFISEILDETPTSA